MSLAPAEDRDGFISPAADLVLITLTTISLSMLIGTFLVVP